jgi:hypothetical protein
LKFENLRKTEEIEENERSLREVMQIFPDIVVVAFAWSLVGESEEKLQMLEMGFPGDFRKPADLHGVKVLVVEMIHDKDHFSCFYVASIRWFDRIMQRLDLPKLPRSGFVQHRLCKMPKRVRVARLRSGSSRGSRFRHFAEDKTLWDIKNEPARSVV